MDGLMNVVSDIGGVGVVVFIIIALILYKGFTAGGKKDGNNNSTSTSTSATASSTSTTSQTPPTPPTV